MTADQERAQGKRPEEWASAYDGDVIDTPVDKAMVQLAEERPPGRALDLGCGTGQNSIWLATRGWTVTGIDIVPKAIAVAQARAAEAGVDVDFRVADVTVFEPEHAYDLVLSTYALPRVGNGRDLALQMASDAVGPGGTLLICEFDASLADDGWMTREDLASLDELTAALRGLVVDNAEVMVTSHEHGDEKRQLAIAIVSASRSRYAPAGA
jgi:2-polyprenyl-3-methyl-5-hydroxy-6-metoxy-1,4-benzoquinol methylase